MEDGGDRRSPATAAVAANVIVRNKKDKNIDVGMSSRPRHAVPFAQIPGITDALHGRLAAVGATEPSFMIGKSLVMSDVNHEQARLLLSCKRGSLPQVAAVLTGTEARFVEDSYGLLVTAFDRAGRSYGLTCKYLVSNSGYRFITGWKPYVQENALGVGAHVELWWFRSRMLHNRCKMRRGKGGKEEKVPVTVESGHPDGSLGLVLLHYDDDGKALPVQETENGVELEQVDEPDEAPPVHETETGHVESKTTMRTEDKLADCGGECPEPMIRERNTDTSSREDIFSAAEGLLKLRKHYDGGGHGAVVVVDEDKKNLPL